MLDFGLKFDDRVLLAVLLDDSLKLEEYLQQNKNLINEKYSIECSYTPLIEVSLLHICAEYNHMNCARLLIQYGADVNSTAGLDKYGFGGQSPIFHTVNQNSGNSKEVMEFLLANSVDLSLTVKGIIWGQNFPWETLIPSVNPISYAMMGLLPQMHRNEKRIADTVCLFLKHQFNLEYIPKNIPNKYLVGGK